MPFDHKNVNAATGEVEQPAVPRVDWITLNTFDGRDLTQPLPLNEKFNAIHCCLIPYGPHRGSVLVLDGNLVNYSMASPSQPLQRIRDKQPWAVVNPYWPATHPYQGSVGHRFYNRVLTLPRDPATNVNLGELFCAGQAWMHDGRLFLAGGTMSYPTATAGFLGSKLTWFFDPGSAAWIQGPDMTVPRWYPAVCYDGKDPARALVLGGTHGGGALDHYESYQVTYGTSPPTAAPDSRAQVGVYQDMRLYAGIPGALSPSPYSRAFTDYPRVHLLTDARFFVSGFEAPGALFLHNVVSDPTYSMNHGLMPSSSADNSHADHSIHYATSIYAPNHGGAFNRIRRIGGLRVAWNGTMDQHSVSKLVEVCDALTTNGTWATGGIPNMYWDRVQANVVILPGGELLAIGGLTWNAQANVAQANTQPELLVNNQFWTPVASQTGARHYHSCALLLPDGRVFVGGGEGHASINSGARPPDYQIYNPPYITMGLSRPQNTVVTTLNHVVISQDAFAGLTYGGTYRVAWDEGSLATGVTVDKVVLMRPAALTHHDDGGQRCVILDSEPFESGTVDFERQFTLPANAYQLPRGWYMLFAVTNQGAPSQLAYWVHVR